MKTIALIFNLLAIGLIWLPVHGQSKKELRNEKAQKEFLEMVELVGSRDFTFLAEHVNTNLFGHQTLMTAPNTLEIKHDSAFCDLPFFGRAYQVNFSERGGLNFEEPYSDWTITQNKRKKEAVVEFKAKKTSDWYQCTLVVQRGGSAILSISSQNRETISFWGSVSKNKTEE